MRDQNRKNPAMEDLFAFKDLTGRPFTATIDGQPMLITGEMVSGNYFQQMGVVPTAGRALQPSDDVPSAAGAIVISDAMWSRLFARSPSVLGKTIQLNFIPVTIVGVAPAGFTGASSVQIAPDLFLPFSLQPLVVPWSTSKSGTDSLLTDKSMWWMLMMARTKAGVSEQSAAAALDVSLAQAIRATMPVGQHEQMPHLRLTPGSRGMNNASRNFAKPIYVLGALTGFVLLLACANLANLLLARSAARQREMSVRLALGATRSRVLRQVLTESLLLSSLGGVAGLVLGYFGRNVIPHLLSSSWQTTPLNTHFDVRIFAFTAAVSIVTGILFGLAPAWQATRTNVSTALKDSASAATRRRKGLLGKGLVVFQVALSALLVVSAGLFALTLRNLGSTNLGLNPKNLIMFSIQAPPSRYHAPQDIALHERIEGRLSRVPGVQSVTLTGFPLLANNVSNSDFQPTDQPVRTGENMPTDMADVGRSFFQTYALPVLYGRGFTSADTEHSPLVAVINQSLAKQFYAGADPIGKSFRTGNGLADLTYQIVGISADAKYNDLRDDPPPTYYILYNQEKESSEMTYVVRTNESPASILPSLRSAVQEVDKDLPLRDVRTQVEQIEATISQERLFATLTSAFGVLALILAAIGIYGIMAYTVARRTSEIGVRMAMGARPQQVRLMVLRESGWMALAGIAAGIGTSIALAKVVRSMLYGLEPTDPTTLIGTACLLFALAVAAAYGPARRASRIDPMQALRHE
jgi:predicted permease